MNCPICGELPAISHQGSRRQGLELWHCALCDFDFLVHDPSRDLAANKLDESRLKAAGLEFRHATGISRTDITVATLVDEYLGASETSANVLNRLLLGVLFEAGPRCRRKALLESRSIHARRYVNEELTYHVISAWRLRG